MNRKKYIVMLGTSFNTMGGISAVVNEYRAAGLFDRFPILYIATHSDGSKLKKLGLCIVAWFRLIALLFAGKAALVHIHVASDASFWRKTLFFCTTFLFRVPTILHLHGAEFMTFYERDCNALGRAIIRYVFDHVDIVIVLSDTWRRWVQTMSKNPRVIPINNPVQLPPAPSFTTRAPFSILFLGRLGNRKGTYDLLAAVSQLVARYPELQLILGGDGELERTKAEAEKLGIGKNVQILGWVAGRDKSALLEHAAVYALPSYAEGLPMSVLEAMAVGLPVVSTPVGAMPEVITDGIDGCLVAPGDVDALTQALGNLLADEALRQRMGLAARTKIERTFSTQQILPKLEQLYQEFRMGA